MASASPNEIRRLASPKPPSSVEDVPAPPADDGAVSGRREPSARLMKVAAEKKRKAAAEEELKRKRLSISLKKTEIDDDIFAMTGACPRRRPKKRPRNVQSLLDNIFPAMSLVGISPEEYGLKESRTCSSD